MESELFGHVRGAFTGAGENKRGLIELANGGTAFFDEIGDLPLELQVKILRLLQEKEYRPSDLCTVRKWISALWLRPIAILRGRLRVAHSVRILYYRLNVIALRMPPLRDRKEDIPDLLERFLVRHGEYTVPPLVMEALMWHKWPGNVRELQNCADRMAAMNPGPELRLEDLPSAVRYPVSGLELSGLAALSAAVGPRPVLTLEEVERHAIMEALDQTKGDRALSAALLGIGRTTLYRKLKTYNLEVQPAP